MPTSFDQDDKHEVQHVDETVPARDLARYGSDDATLAKMQEMLEWDDETRRKRYRAVLWKIDLKILFPILLMYILNYLDRNSIAQARLVGLVKHNNLTADQYSTINAIFSVSYVLCQLPSNLLLTKVRPSIYLPSVMILWAIVSSCSAVTTSFGQLLAVRIALGIVEAPFFPGALYFMSCWYTRKEIGKRIAVLVSGILLSNAFAGLIAAGIINGLGNKRGILSYQWLFIIEGSITVAFAICLYFLLPDYPHNTKSFSLEERLIARMRLDDDIGSPDNSDVGVLAGLKLAVRDWKSWAFGILQMSMTTLIGFNQFFPTLVEGLGYENKITILLLTAPPYLVAFFIAFGFSWHADRRQERSWHDRIAVMLCIVGLVMIVATPTHLYKVRYGATFFVTAGSFAGYNVTYPWLASVVPRPHTKRAAAIAIANSMSNCGAFYTSYIFIARYGPSYNTSWYIVLAFAIFLLFHITGIAYLLKRANAKLDILEDRYARNRMSAEDFEQLDSDEVLAVQNGFRYTT